MSGLASTWVDVLATASWQVALLVAGVLAVQRLAGDRLAPRARYALWLVVAARLCLPVLPEARLAPVPWNGGAGPAADVATTVGSAAEPAAASPVLSAPTARRPVPRARAARADAPAEGPGRERARGTTALRTRTEGSGGLGAGLVLALAWLAGALALLARDARRELRFRRALRAARPVEDPRLLALVDEARERFGVRRSVAVLRVDALPAPALAGHLRPRLLLPAHALARDPDELRGVVAHELAHLARGDVPLNALLVVVRAVWWFHPLAHLALARLRAAQEEARDDDALRSAPERARIRYAHALVRLAEDGAARRRAPLAAAALVPLVRGRRGLARRVHMILNPMPHARTTRLLGGALVLACAAGGLVAAAPGASPGGATESDARSGDAVQRSIVVEQQAPPPAWRAALDAKLDAPIDLALDGAPLADAFAAACAALGVDVVVGPSVADLDGGAGVDLRLSGTPGRDVLDLLAWHRDDVAWGVHAGAVVVGDRYDLPRELDLRFYKVAPIVDGYPSEDRDDLLDELADLVQECLSERVAHSWECDGSSIDVWQGLLVVRQGEDAHREVQAFLDRLLRRDHRPERADAAWRERARAALQRRASFEFDEVPVTEAAAFVSQVSGLPVLVDPDAVDEGVLVSLSLRDATAETALAWIARASDRHVVLRDGAVLLSARPDTETVLYEIAPLLVHEARSGDVLDGTEDLIRNTVDPGSWDEWPRLSIRYFGDLMVVTQTPRNQDHVARLLATIERALD